MTKSIRSINIIIRLDLMGHDVSDDSIKEVIHNMDYHFTYEDDYVRIVDSEVIDTFVE